VLFDENIAGLPKRGEVSGFYAGRRARLGAEAVEPKREFK
jgi:hypothetical protein